jgi:hypothetical protein
MTTLRRRLKKPVTCKNDGASSWVAIHFTNPNLSLELPAFLLAIPLRPNEAGWRRGFSIIEKVGPGFTQAGILISNSMNHLTLHRSIAPLLVNVSSLGPCRA